MTEYENRAEDHEHNAVEWLRDATPEASMTTAALLAISARIADLTDAVRSVQQ